MEDIRSYQDFSQYLRNQDFIEYQRRYEQVDRISSLPDEIIGRILSFLPTKEAVRTSILCDRWKYCFAFASSFNFVLDDNILRLNSKRCISKSFMNSVNRALFMNNRTSIEKFSLMYDINSLMYGIDIDPSRVSDWIITVIGIDPSSVCGWIYAVISHGVQHLDIDISLPKFFPCTKPITSKSPIPKSILPSALFTCRTLVTLKLKIRLILYVPNHVCLPMLKALHLKSFEFQDENAVDRLVSSCISLEELVIEDCDMNFLEDFKLSHPLLKRLTIISGLNYCLRALLIDAPNLLYFKFSDSMEIACVLLNLQSLVNADVHFNLCNKIDRYQRVATGIFTEIRNVRTLDLSVMALEVLLFFDLSHLLKLVQLKIYCENCQDLEHITVGLTDLLGKHPPGLKKVALYEEFVKLKDLSTEVPSCLNFNLMEIEILDSYVDQNSIKKAKYFLKNTTHLEKLTIHAKRDVAREKKLVMAEGLLASPQKSSQCCIIIV